MLIMDTIEPPVPLFTVKFNSKQWGGVSRNSSASGVCITKFGYLELGLLIFCQTENP